MKNATYHLQKGNQETPVTMFAAPGHALIFSGLRRALALPGSLQRIVPRWQHLEKNTVTTGNNTTAASNGLDFPR